MPINFFQKKLCHLAELLFLNPFVACRSVFTWARRLGQCSVCGADGDLLCEASHLHEAREKWGYLGKAPCVGGVSKPEPTLYSF